MGKKYLSRIIVIVILTILFLLAIISRLFSLQIVNGEGYAASSYRRIVKTTPQKAQRGEILDRYGRVMVTNQIVYNLEISRYKKDSTNLNDTVYSLILLAERENQAYQDKMPVSQPPYRYTESEKTVQSYLKSLELDMDMPAEELISVLLEKYKIPDTIPDNYIKKVIGVRAEMEIRQFSSNNPFVFAKDVNMDIVTIVKENKKSYPGVNIITSYSRMYPEPVAAHVLGRVGPIYAEEYNSLKNLGYGLTDIIGKEGLEKVYDLELKGRDGILKVEQDANGKITGESVIQEAVSGNDIILTLDMNLQKKTEQSLKEIIANVKATVAKDAGGGAACVIDIHSGEVLAMASYPDFNLATFEEDYNENYNNTQNPFWNRAISGTYEPGSTFKILPAIAALEENIVSPMDTILDKGKYTLYPDYQPVCHIFPGNHGYVNVSKAIEVSCNYYFYETGRLLDIEKLHEYGKKFGFGEYTGIEMAGEEKGLFMTPDYTKSLGQVWYPGNTLQIAIGQLNLFTPIQLANYLATVVNGGTRFRPHLLLSVKDPENNIIKETMPEILEEIQMKPQNYKAVMEGMKSVTEDGTASSTFRDFFIEVGGKTGTAEVTGTNNGLFIAFAPYENPKIAISVVVEHGEHGNTIAPVARDIISAYFSDIGLDTDENYQKFEIS